MIVIRTKLFDEIENIQNILNNMRAQEKGPGDPKYDKLSQNLKNRQTINNSSLPKNTIRTTNPTAITKIPNQSTKTSINAWNKLGKAGKAGIIGAGILSAGLAAKSIIKQ